MRGAESLFSVVRGTGGEVVTAVGVEDFEGAIRLKIIKITTLTSNTHTSKKR
jgi:hypothetical protein